MNAGIIILIIFVILIFLAGIGLAVWYFGFRKTNPPLNTNPPSGNTGPISINPPSGNTGPISINPPSGNTGPISINPPSGNTGSIPINPVNSPLPLNPPGCSPPVVELQQIAADRAATTLEFSFRPNVPHTGYRLELSNDNFTTVSIANVANTDQPCTTNCSITVPITTFVPTLSSAFGYSGRMRVIQACGVGQASNVLGVGIF